LYQDACGSVNHVAVRNEIPGDIPTGIQSGQGIMVETTNTTGPVQLTVQNSSVHNYNKNGILARYGGATLNATGNYVQGYGPTGVIAQNGIELAFEGAAGSIKNNTVIDNYYTGNDASASDILLYDSSETTTVSVSGNTVGNSNIGISLNNIAGSFGDNVSVTGNKVFGSSLFDGIDACSNGNTITGNSIFNSTQSGIHLDVSCIGTGTNNTVTGNTIEESECAGVLNEGSSNTTSPNTFYTVPFTVTNTTTACTPPAALVSRARTQNKVSP
jgi:parallel beta-helix repeat protein